MATNSVQVQPFGLSFDLQNFSQTSSNVIAGTADSIIHGPLGAVSQVQWSNGTSITLNPAQNATTKGVVYKTGARAGSSNIMFAYGRFGAGRFAAIGDSSPCDDGTGDPADGLYNGYTGDAAGNHRKLLMNATIWLTSAGSGSAAGVTNFSSSNKVVLPIPNPAAGSIRLYCTNDAAETLLRITDLAGRVVFSKDYRRAKAGDIITIPMISGSYILNVRVGSTIQTERIVVY